jgi:predicted CXXCH cytochrome family protein
MTLARLRWQHLRWFIAAALTCLLFVALAVGASAAQGDNTTCLGCHSSPGLNTKLLNNEVLPLTLDPTIYTASVHGAVGMQCIACHTNISGYPHPKLTAKDRRDFQMERYQQCQSCHPDQYKASLDSNHARALAAGNRQAAICTDCHGAHDVQKSNQPRQKISATCQKCHSAIYEKYTASVHGAALMDSSNPDVPVCTDCHGAHSQADPTTAAFRLKSPDICGKCHGNAALMKKYDISIDVFNTYVADFHGTTVTLFEKQHPDQQTNKAVCTDCHGVHDIMQVTDANASVVKENLLATCRRCHPDATANFPDSWVGHFQPNRSRFPIVYYVNLFYKFLIPAVIGAMALFVAVDAMRRIIHRFQRKSGS